MPYFANQSRVGSWAGTAITAPVLQSINTKLATMIGRAAAIQWVKGHYRPVLCLFLHGRQLLRQPLVFYTSSRNSAAALFSAACFGLMGALQRQPHRSRPSTCPDGWYRYRMSVSLFSTAGRSSSDLQSDQSSYAAWFSPIRPAIQLVQIGQQLSA